MYHLTRRRIVKIAAVFVDLAREGERVQPAAVILAMRFQHQPAVLHRQVKTLAAELAHAHFPGAGKIPAAASALRPIPIARNAQLNRPSRVMRNPLLEMCSAGRGALDAHLQHIKRLRGGDEQMVALGSGETDIGGGLGQAEAAESLPCGLPDRDAGITQDRVGAGPDVAGPVSTHAVRDGNKFRCNTTNALRGFTIFRTALKLPFNTFTGRKAERKNAG